MLARIHVPTFEGEEWFDGPVRLIGRVGGTWYSLYWLFFLCCAWSVVTTFPEWWRGDSSRLYHDGIRFNSDTV